MKYALALIAALAPTPMAGQTNGFVVVESATVGRSIVTLVVRANNPTSFAQTGLRAQCRGMDWDGRVLDLSELTLPSMQAGETVYREVILRADPAMQTVVCEELR